ncbi:hypothetical protein GCM10012275_03930 [Longimycelium tulufanense]|uniref:Uncharacterized protein n=1 Tax=Longimycelium tulufanense TaxID=907463 RepID=A0A8J3CA71_9PSEU|nr:hypothetical protein [Longimycelium tulufanense]GGM35883.1 hypothetical protein GCM10012275_03930 [Longimycelium tulufanense]
MRRLLILALTALGMIGLGGVGMAQQTGTPTAPQAAPVNVSCTVVLDGPTARANCENRLTVAVKVRLRAKCSVGADAVGPWTGLPPGGKVQLSVRCSAGVALAAVVETRL